MWTSENATIDLVAFLGPKMANTLGCRLKNLKKEYNKGFWLVQNITMRESVLNQIVRLWNQVVAAADNFGRDQSLSPIQITTKSIYVDEQFKLVHKAGGFVNRPYIKICVTLLQYNVDSQKNSYAKIQKFAKKREKIFNNYSV